MNIHAHIPILLKTTLTLQLHNVRVITYMVKSWAIILLQDFKFHLQFHHHHLPHFLNFHHHCLSHLHHLLHRKYLVSFYCPIYNCGSKVAKLIIQYSNSSVVPFPHLGHSNGSFDSNEYTCQFNTTVVRQ